MATQDTPYVPRAAGDLLSATDWNHMQVLVKNDITDQIEKAMGQVDDVPHAGDADKLEGKTLEEITSEIIQKTLEAIPKVTGQYRRIFRRLELGEENRVEHGLGAFPLTDVYQLEYFPAVCACGEDDDEEPVRWVNFFLYHSNERRIRIPGRDQAKPFMIEIEEMEGHAARLKLADLLDLYEVNYTDTTDLEELEADFWDAFFEKPSNDEFDPSHYCHSPWFEKCCGERRSVKELKERGDWDRIYLKFKTRKTVNALSSNPLKLSKVRVKDVEMEEHHMHVELLTVNQMNTYLPYHITAAPSQVQVVHYDFDTLGLRLIDKPVYPEEQMNGHTHPESKRKIIGGLSREFLEELKVMVLLQV